MLVNPFKQIFGGNRAGRPGSDGFFEDTLYGNVDHGVEVGTGKVFGLFGHLGKVDTLLRFIGDLQLQDGFAAGGVGRRDENDAVETAGAAKSRVEMPGNVGSPDDEQAVVIAVNAVEFGQKLVDDVTACALFHVGALGTEGIDLVEEEDARLLFAGQVEVGSQLFFAVPNPHIEDVVEADVDEVGVDLPGGSPGDEGLAAAGWAVKQDTAANLLAVASV